MAGQHRKFMRHRMWQALCLALSTFLCSAVTVEAQPIKGPLHNEDCTNFFWTHGVPEGTAGEVIDQYVDVMADAGVKVFLCNTNGRKTIYQSDAWESYWDGYDPDGPDDQPFLAPIPPENVAGYRAGISNMLAVHQQGIDYPARVIQRCRHHGISPWITLRMNDCHYNDIPTHPFHGSFWKDNPQLTRQGCSGYFASCLDYANQEVRDYYMALVAETLDRYDIDGLELDFMREPFLFSAGKEAEGTPILTAWMREVRKKVGEAAARRGHPIRLGVRVPSRPEAALGLGLDAIGWAKEGLIDLLVVTPRWAALEFDMPIKQWRDLLGDSKVTLAGGLEVLYRPYPHGPASLVTPAMATGAAVSVLSQGADAVYLFNFFQDRHPAWPLPVYQRTLKSMASLDTLLNKPRCIGVTFRDIVGPGERYQPPLPAKGKELVFPMKLGPIPDDHWLCDLLIGFAPSNGAPMPVPTVSINGTPCEVRDDTIKDGLRLISFTIPVATLTTTDTQEIKVVGKGPDALSVQRVEVSLRKPDEADGQSH